MPLVVGAVAKADVVLIGVAIPCAPTPPPPPPVDIIPGTIGADDGGRVAAALVGGEGMKWDCCGCDRCCCPYVVDDCGNEG